MNGREAVEALLFRGKRVTRSSDPDKYVVWDRVTGYLKHEDGSPSNLQTVIDHHDWREWSAPLTDEQLIAEWERQAESSFQVRSEYEQGYGAGLAECARQLKERKL